MSESHPTNHSSPGPPPPQEPQPEQREDDEAGLDTHAPGGFNPAFHFEEGLARYRPGGFHPVHLGEIYNNKYLVLRKLGYGSFSTVWLVQDTSFVFAPFLPHLAHL